MTFELTRRSALGIVTGLTLPVTRTWAEEPTTVRMAYDIPIWTLPFFVATDRKLWSANGISSVYLPGPSGMSNLIAASGGATDLGVAGEISVAIAGLTKVSARVIACFNEVENMELACLSTIRKPADIVGKRIAIAQGTPSHYYVSLLAKKYGIGPAQVSLVRLGPTEMISALLGGSVDGFVWQEPFLSKAVAADPARFHRLAEPGLVTTNAVLVAGDAAIREKRPALIAALRSLDQASKLIAAEPAESVRIGAQYSKMDADAAAAAIRPMKFGLTLNVPELSQKLAEQARWAIAEGVARPDAIVPDYSKSLDPTLLQEMKQV
jgi:ABC-type nitrate/sulfonate/bicarbonate transport system substrate-binding protein